MPEGATSMSERMLDESLMLQQFPIHSRQSVGTEPGTSGLQMAPFRRVASTMSHGLPPMTPGCLTQGVPYGMTLHSPYAASPFGFNMMADETSLWPSLHNDAQKCKEILLTVADRLSTNGDKNFFLLLGLPCTLFDSIERRFSEDARRLNLECLMVWIQRESQRATPQRLIDVLRSEQIGRTDITEYIERELNIEPQPT
jgi:hypothetical protein